MKLEMAIELERKDLFDPGCVAIEDLIIARTLGIEAMKEVGEARLMGSKLPHILLPGETID